jgi:hypothetical protein
MTKKLITKERIVSVEDNYIDNLKSYGIVTDFLDVNQNKICSYYETLVCEKYELYNEGLSYPCGFILNEDSRFYMSLLILPSGEFNTYRYIYDITIHKATRIANRQMTMFGRFINRMIYRDKKYDKNYETFNEQNYETF